MKKSLFIILFAFSVISSFGQTSIEGTFSNEEDSLIFQNGSVSLSIMSNGGLIFPIKGEGEYRISESILLVKTGKNHNILSQKALDKELGFTKFLENETVVFKINKQAENQLELTLLGISENVDFQGKKTIKKFERDHKKLVYRTRELKRITF